MDSDIYGGDINTYGILFEPPADLQGKIGMFKGSGEVTAMAEIYLGHSRCNENPEYMKEVLALLQAQKPHVKVYNSDGILERLAAGDTAVHTHWNGYSHRARREAFVALCLL